MGNMIAKRELFIFRKQRAHNIRSYLLINLGRILAGTRAIARGEFIQVECRDGLESARFAAGMAPG